MTRNWMLRLLNHKYKFMPFLVAVLLLTAFALPQNAWAVRVSMKRVIFDNSKRTEVLTIINNTGEDQTYRLGWRKFRMTEKGLTPLKDDDNSPDLHWAQDMIRFAPHRISVPAGGSQQIRLLFRPTKDLAEGEYRSHLWIVTEAKPEEFKADGNSDSNQAVKLAVQPAISLPVFIRAGNLDAKVEMKDLSAQRKGDSVAVSMDVLRDGNRSVYGDFDFVCTSDGKDLVLQQTRGISVYTELTNRPMTFNVALSTPEAQACKSMKVTYRSDPEDTQFKGAVLAEGSVNF